MRIKPPSAPKQERVQIEPKERLRSRASPSWLLLAITLCLVLIALAAIWYVQEGHEVVRVLFLGPQPHTDAPVDDLPTLEVEISPEAYHAMYQQWNASLRNRILQLDERDWVQGQIRFRGKRIRASLWLKEEEPENWQESKWSLKVKLQDDDTVLGMRSFAAQSPAVHRYLDEWLYTQDLQSVGILAPRYAFVHVWMNGDDWGVYALQEGISDAFFTSQKRTAGPVIRIDDSLYGRQRTWLDGGDSGETVFGGPGFAYVDEWNAAEVERDPALKEQSTAALGLLRAFQSNRLIPSQVFDVESMGRYIAHASLWGARYGTRFEGERYYYHPLKSQLEPVGGDALPLEPAYAYLPGLAQYDDLAIMRAFAQEALAITQPERLRSLQNKYGDGYRRYRAALSQEFPSSELTPPWDMLAERQAILFSSLHPPETVHAYCVSQESGAAVDVRVGNLVMYPVVLDRIRVRDHTIDVRGDWIVHRDDTLLHQEAAPAVVLRRMPGGIPRYVTLRIPRSELFDFMPQGSDPCSATSIDFGSRTVTDTLQLVTHVVGVDDAVVAHIQPDVPPAPSAPVLPAQPTVEQALARHPFLVESERAGYLELKPGDWEVTGDLILPDRFGLLASQALTLRFDPGAVLFANGPLLLHGSVDAEILFVPKEDHWGGIVVLGAGDENPSSWSYVTIRAATGVQRSGWHVSGGVTFYESSVVLAHCRLLDALAGYALHIARSRFECAHTEFGYASAHALRGDFAEGRVEECMFHDVLGNALDVSGSNVSMQSIDLSRVYDHGISASRYSVVTLEGGRAEDVGVVASSSDMSHVHVQDVHVVQAWTAGFAAYTGEMGYGPASIRASGVVFDDQDAIQGLPQQGSSVRLEGAATDTSEFDVRDLRWRRQISPTIHALSYRLGPAIWLVGYDLVSTELPPGDSLQLMLYWRTHKKLDRDYTIFVHVRDASGQTITGWDTEPRENTFPTTGWPVGKVIDDLHAIPLPRDIPSGEYQVVLGMYYWPTGERLPVYDPDGGPLPSGEIFLEQRFSVTLE